MSARLSVAQAFARRLVTVASSTVHQHAQRVRLPRESLASTDLGGWLTTLQVDAVEVDTVALIPEHTHRSVVASTLCQLGALIAVIAAAIEEQCGTQVFSCSLTTAPTDVLVVAGAVEVEGQ